MSQVTVAIDSDTKPANLPSPEVIVQKSLEDLNLGKRFFSLLDEASGVPYAFVKRDWSVKKSEALTQQFVTQIFNDDPDAAVRAPLIYLVFESDGIGFIVMEWIEGSTCTVSDAQPVAAAINALISVKGSSLEPGPVGGGRIGHPFFMESESSVRYKSVGGLEKHINGILATTGHKERVDLASEVAAYGLRLCQSDLNQNNFMKDKLGRIVAIDFGDCCFLPLSFMEFALKNSADPFIQRIAPLILLPKLTQYNALLTASLALVPFGTNNIGLPRPRPRPRPIGDKAK